MALTRLDNLYSSKTGRYLYVSPDDFNASDELSNRGNSPLSPFKTIQRAFIEVSRYSYLPGRNNDRFDQFSIMLMPGNHYIDNRPGLVNYEGQGGRFFDAANLIITNKNFIAEEAVARMRIAFPTWVSPTGNTADCTDDVKAILEELAYNIKFGGNNKIWDAANLYVQGAHVQGEETQTVFAFEAARDIAIQVMKNEDVEIQGSHGLSQTKNTGISLGPITQGATGPTIAYGQENTCSDVSSAITTLFAVLIDAVGIPGDPGNLDNIPKTFPESDEELPIFNYNRALQEWQDNSILDLSNPDNVLYKFNASTGGAIVPRGCSLIGYDLRRTIVRPLYVPDPADGDQDRTSIFNLTGGCYLWQFTIKDGDLSSNSPLFDSAANVGKVYFQKGNTAQLAIPEYSHHKITIMTYADGDDLNAYYQKIGRSFAKFQPTIDDDGEFSALVQENRIVGPLSDTRRVDSIQIIDSDPAGTLTVRVTTKIDHGYFVEQYVAIIENGLNELLNGTVKVTAIDSNNPRVFEYVVNTTSSAIGLIDGQIYTISNGLSPNCVAQAEIDSVESASPYVFNCSIRSTWGLCGMWADGSKATGFKSMVVAQYTGVSLQKDDRAFIRYDELTNTWNQASLTDAFGTVAYHTKGDAYWKNDWRNFHIRASDDAFIQCVSVFAVGFFDHFLMESGGDMSITNSNSNFGNTSLHARGFKGFAFNQDKGGYITDIIPPKVVNVSPSNEDKIQYYTLDIQASNDIDNHTKLYIGSDDAVNPADRPAATVDGFRIGAKTDEKLYVKLDDGVYNSVLDPTGFTTYTASLSTLNPSGINIDHVAQDASNRIEDNKLFIQEEAYLYVTRKYPDLLVNQNITISKCQRDIGYFVDAVVSDLRLGGNINTIQAAEGYFVGGQLAYIEGERDETIEALDYVKHLCIAAMRNFDYLIKNCTTTAGSEIVDVGNTTGLVIGMTVSEYNPADFTNGKLNSGAVAITTNIPANTYIKRILDDSRIELGDVSGKLNDGNTVNALQNSSTSYLYFDLPGGAFSGIIPTSDDTIIQDTNYPECLNIATTITEYFTDIFTILNQGLTPLGGREIDAHNLILANKELIAEVAVDRMLTNFPGFAVPGGNQECIDDIVDVLETIAFNVKYGGNNKVYEAGEIYITGGHVEQEEDQAVFAFLEARDMAIQAMRNEPINITGSSKTQYIDPTVIVDPQNPTCADVATTLTNLFSIITQAIGTSTTPGTLSGVTKEVPQITSVIRVEPELDVEGLGKRGTLFTVNTGNGQTDPHLFETGTPVRLVPKAKEGRNPDKRVIRLPKGFQSNQKYYVIAPGRFTQPFDYSGTTLFDGSQQNVLMLSTTKENAAAGIYIYSPETDSVDDDIEIEIQQYVLDDVYDLHKYTCNLAGAGEIETDVSHIFDLPNASVEPQRVFFRQAEDIIGSELPEISGGATIDTQKYYFARFITPKKFSIHATHAQAIAGTDSISLVPGSGQDFYVYANKRRSPVKFDAEFTTESNKTGLWYLQVKDESSLGNQRVDSILNKFKDQASYGPGSGKLRTLDTWFTRLSDTRDKGDRVYRLRYVVPKYLSSVRDPLNGFILKIRTDDKRRLVPQRFILTPQGGAPDVARFDNPIQANERLGYSVTDLRNIYGITTPTYDPYLNPKKITSDKTNSKIAFSIQSARVINLTPGAGQTDRLELTVFDHEITNDLLKGEIFTVVQTSLPQGGSGVFVANSTSNTTANEITWSGYSNGSAYVQAFTEDGENGYLVLKNVVGNIEFENIQGTRFEQGSVSAVLNAKPNSIGDPEGRDKSNRDDFLYRVDGANVYTVLPNDTVTDDNNNNYTIERVQDVGDFEDTFYIFDIDTIQQRIPGQQDGVYYLTCVRGNISPYPTGAGVGDNFRDFKFSQPISQLYPINYKNDPVWYKQINPVYNDPPASIAAADNYIHGLVTINDSKRSETKEGIYDLIDQPSLQRFNFLKSEDLQSPTLNPIGGSTIIEAQEGNATSGSEDRYIPISGDSEFPTESRIYVELRRPSIARSGNHTFEYLGFGPGNYSTGFPLRQEVVLEDVQDFYAQSKKEDGGIVFYTGLNSNGDLYIGNRKINAITGEETYLERASLEDSADDSTDNLGGLVTTFDNPVTFNDRITVEGNANFNSPVEISVGAFDGTPLRIFSVVDSAAGDDITLSRAQFSRSNDGDITLGKNRINAAIFGITPRQILGFDGNPYTIRTHFTNGIGPSNITPDQASTFSSLQYVEYSPSQSPKAGDILLKGKQVGFTGSLGWIFANAYTQISNEDIQSITSDGIYLTLEFKNNNTNADFGIGVGTQIRISDFLANPNLNGVHTIISDGFDPNGITCKFQVIITPADGTVYTWSTIPGAKLEVSSTKWKEVGVLGAESIRTNTDTWGDYKLGINTLARAENLDYTEAYTSEEVKPRANLDILGNTFISGYKTDIEIGLGGGQEKTLIALDNALLIGGNSQNPDTYATLRVATSDVDPGNKGTTYRDGGRFGINTSIGLDASTELDRNLVVVGDGRITGNFLIEDDLSVDGGDINSKVEVFNFLNNNVELLNALGDCDILNIANTTTGVQNINIGNNTPYQVFRMGGNATNSVLEIHKNATNSMVDIASTTDTVGSTCQILLGGAFGDLDSKTNIGTRQTRVAGDLEIGYKFPAGTSSSRLFSRTSVVDLFDGDETRTVNFATNAAELTMASLGGTTTVRNNLKVLASIDGNSNIRLNGGLTAGIIKVDRARFGTSDSTHIFGSLDNPNIDFYKYIQTGRTIDTAGVGFWGDTNYLTSGGQIAGIDNISAADPARQAGSYSFIFPDGGTGEGASFNVTVGINGDVVIEISSPGIGYSDDDLLTIEDAFLGGGGAEPLTFQVNGVNVGGNNYILPISTPSPFDFRIGDLLLIDRGHPDSPDEVGSGDEIVTDLRNEAYSEIVRVVGLTNVTNPQDPSGYRITVSRSQEGTAARIDHPDNCVISKLDKQANASYITGVDLDENGVLDQGAAGVPSGDADINIGVAEFGGVLTTKDYLRLSGSEFVKVLELVSTDIKSLIVNDGGNPKTNMFVVESTTGNTFARGDLNVGAGFNKFIVDGPTGNTNVAGTLTTEGTLTINGSVVPNTQFFTITNGGSQSIALRTTLQVDTATGDLTINGGSINIFGTDGTTPRLTFSNSSGDFTTYGSFSALGSGISTFGGTIKINTGGLDIKFKDLGELEIDRRVSVKDNDENELFSIESDGGMTVAQIDNYITRTGGRRWDYVDGFDIEGEANVNYFVNATQNTLFKLPRNPLIGDMIRIIDIGGNLTHNLSLVVRAEDGTNIQNVGDNTGSAMLNGVPSNALIGYNGGELVVQTPYAAFALVFAGTSTPDGDQAVPSSKAGWYLVEV